MRKILVFTTAAIIYGSLFPFAFETGPETSSRWSELFSNLAAFTSIGDVLGNIVLFVPFGYLYFEELSPKTPRKSAYIKVLLHGFILSFIIQLIQVYIPSRSPAIADVYWNEVGIIIGVLFTSLKHKYFPRFSFGEASSIPVVIALLWGMYLLFPFVPTLDFQEIKNSLKPVFLSPVFQWDDFIIALTGWMVFYYFTRDLFHHSWLNRFRLPLLAVLSLPARVLILENSIDLSDIFAIISAIIMAPIFNDKISSKDKFLASLVIFSISAYALGSFDFTSRMTPFFWIPFSGFLDGSLFSNTRSLFFKLFLFSSLIWLVRAGWPHKRLKLLWMFLFLLVIEVIQIFMKTHSAEITDPVLLLLLALFIPTSKGGFNERPEKQPEETSRAPQPLGKSIFSNKIKKYRFIILGVVFITLGLSIVIKLPGVPYNVRELFRLNGLFISIIPFALFILWFGGSIPVICQRMLKVPNLHIIRFPLWVFGAGIISYALLKISVTNEALDDIVGSSNIYWFVTNQNIWGTPGVLLSKIIPIQELWNQIEEVVRFLALFSPVTFILCILYNSLNIIHHFEIKGIHKQSYLVSISLLLNLFYALPWLYLCKIISFDYSSTDNLNELIARDGFFGLGGGGYLYCLFIIIALNTSWLSQSSKQWAFRVLSIILGGCISWFLLNLALEPEVHKYGNIFSGVDFLLGPDRKTKLPESILFLRWMILYSAGIGVLVWGMSVNYHRKVEKSQIDQMALNR